MCPALGAFQVSSIRFHVAFSSYDESLRSRVLVVSCCFSLVCPWHSCRRDGHHLQCLKASAYQLRTCNSLRQPTAQPHSLHAAELLAERRPCNAVLEFALKIPIVVFRTHAGMTWAPGDRQPSSSQTARATVSGCIFVVRFLKTEARSRLAQAHELDTYLVLRCRSWRALAAGDHVFVCIKYPHPLALGKARPQINRGGTDCYCDSGRR